MEIDCNVLYAYLTTLKFVVIGRIKKCLSFFCFMKVNSGPFMYDLFEGDPLPLVSG